MPIHDFSRLSAYDFEELVRDLLQAHWGDDVESFTAGRDQGIDLRFRVDTPDETIIQCKHMPNEKAATLIARLKADEVEKVGKLEPKRYVLVTSAGLTPLNKKVIKTLFDPYIRKQTDVIGRERLNALLRLHPAVETSNFKLWFTSTPVMQRVLHAAEQVQTDLEIERISRMLPLFVQNEAYPRANEILDSSHVVVIAGPPGIGKSTLADLLLFSHMDRGYRPIIVRDRIEDARKQLNRNDKQIFYFDDFLGETFLGDKGAGHSQSSELLSFIEAVRHSEKTRFVLATREHVLNAALSNSERLRHSTLLDHKTLLELKSYSRGQRARILYNHIYFSELPNAYRSALLEKSFYLRVIDHRGFTPRTIRHLSNYRPIRAVAPEDFQAHVLNLLENPTEIWRHAFEQEISEDARTLLLCMATDLFFSRLPELEDEWEALSQHRASKYGFSRTFTGFRRALDELEGSFLVIDRHNVRFANPSIRDFLGELFRQHRNLVEDIQAAAIRFSQIEFLLQLAVQRPAPQLEVYIARLWHELPAILRPLLYKPYLRWTDENGTKSGLYIDTRPEFRLVKMVEWSEMAKSQPLLDLAREVVQAQVEGWPDRFYIDRLGSIKALEAMDSASWFLRNGGEDVRRRLLDRILQDADDARHYEWRQLLDYAKSSRLWTPEDDERLIEALKIYRSESVFEEIRSCSSEQELAETRDGLIALAEDHGMVFEGAVEAVERRLTEEDYKRERSDEDDDWARPGSICSGGDEENSDEHIHSLFQTITRTHDAPST